MRLIVLMAISGAGKDHFAAHSMPKAETLASADDWFKQLDGSYVFNPTELGAAHGDCFRRVIEALLMKHELIVVNNTNTSIAEIAPYMMAAQAYGAEARIICLRIDPKIAAARNIHGTPLATVEKMAKRLDETLNDLPPWWDVQTLNWNSETSEYVPS
jgi:predicted kinase